MKRIIWIINLTKQLIRKCKTLLYYNNTWASLYFYLSKNKIVYILVLKRYNKKFYNIAINTLYMKIKTKVIKPDELVQSK